MAILKSLVQQLLLSLVLDGFLVPGAVTGRRGIREGVARTGRPAFAYGVARGPAWKLRDPEVIKWENESELRSDRRSFVV